MAGGWSLVPTTGEFRERLEAAPLVRARRRNCALSGPQGRPKSSAPGSAREMLLSRSVAH